MIKDSRVTANRSLLWELSLHIYYKHCDLKHRPTMRQRHCVWPIREGVWQRREPALLVEELVCGGLQAPDPVHGGAVQQLHHQQGVSEWQAHPGGEYSRQRGTESCIQGQDWNLLCLPVGQLVLHTASAKPWVQIPRNAVLRKWVISLHRNRITGCNGHHSFTIA